jgi:HAD superfamily hydrolase (TIGR01490 family)
MMNYMPNPSPQIAAFFDMDKTLLQIDSGMSWSKFLYRRGELQKRMMVKALYWSTLYKLALLDMEDVFSHLAQTLQGESESELIAKCQTWYWQDVVDNVAPRGRAAIAAHRSRGHLIVLATGSTQYASAPVAQGEGIEHVLSSRLDVFDGKFTGRVERYCFGTHKVDLVKQFCDVHNVNIAQSYFYSDSYNDLPLLSQVGNPVAVNADVRLMRHAQQHGWAREAWM